MTADTQNLNTDPGNEMLQVVKKTFMCTINNSLFVLLVLFISSLNTGIFRATFTVLLVVLSVVIVAIVAKTLLLFLGETSIASFCKKTLTRLTEFRRDSNANSSDTLFDVFKKSIERTVTGSVFVLGALCGHWLKYGLFTSLFSVTLVVVAVSCIAMGAYAMKKSASENSPLHSFATGLLKNLT